jgi:hypothetical protein
MQIWTTSTDGETAWDLLIGHLEEVADEDDEEYEE